MLRGAGLVEHAALSRPGVRGVGQGSAGGRRRTEIKESNGVGIEIKTCQRQQDKEPAFDLKKHGMCCARRAEEVKVRK